MCTHVFIKQMHSEGTSEKIKEIVTKGFHWIYQSSTQYMYVLVSGERVEVIESLISIYSS